MHTLNAHKKHRRLSFRRDLLPAAADYFRPLIGELNFNDRGWARTRCPFHDDPQAALNVHRERGGFYCRTCGARGGDLIDFEMLRSGYRFKAVCGLLGAWK